MAVGISVRDLITPALRRLMSGEAAKRALRAGAMVLARDTRLAWKEPGRRPAAWAPLAAATVKRKGHGTILVDTGHLKDSITLGEVTERQATVGTDAPYALYLQMGTKSMAARPFVPVTGAGELTGQAGREIGAAMEAAIRAGIR